MKVLVTTRSKVGARANDFSNGIRDWELLVVPHQLRPGTFADDDSGEARCFYGMSSYGTTTVAEVHDIRGPHLDQLILDFEATLRRELDGMQINFSKRAATCVKRTVDIAERYPVGTVLEFRDNKEQVRKYGQTIPRKG